MVKTRPMSNEHNLPDIRFDAANLYQEEVFTDRTAGTIRRLMPVLRSGERDASRPVLFSGQTQLLTPGGVLPLGFEIEAATLEEAMAQFPAAVQEALNQAIEEAREMRREQQSRIVVPEAGGWRWPAGRRAHQALDRPVSKCGGMRCAESSRAGCCWLPHGLLAAASGRRRSISSGCSMPIGEPGQWFTVGRSYDEQRYSPLARINTGNVAQLGLAWYADFDTNRGQEASPIVIDGVLYVTSAWSKVYAFNAKTGKLLWKYDPQVPGQIGIKGCCDVVNRGLAAWKGRIYVGTYDGRLIALDAKTGKVVWSVQTMDPSKAYTITGAPRIANGKVIIGNAGSEIGVRGYVSAYDASDGRLLWRFYTMPGDPVEALRERGSCARPRPPGRATCTGSWAAARCGMASSTSRSTNLVYFGTANGTPWVAEARSPQGGDNLFTNCIVAVNADTGALCLALPDDAGRDLGLRRHQSADAGRSHARWRRAARADAGVEERLLLCAGCDHAASCCARRTTPP